MNIGVFCFVLFAPPKPSPKGRTLTPLLWRGVGVRFGCQNLALPWANVFIDKPLYNPHPYL